MTKFIFLGLLVSFSTSPLAQSNTSEKVNAIKLQPDITEAEIASYYPDKDPVTRWENLAPSSELYQSPFKMSLFSPENGEDSDRLWSQTKAIFGYGFGVIGVISLLPEGISNWDNDDDFFNKWSDNVTGSPVWDRDNGPLNLLGHPYFGGVYYQVARKSGYRQWDAFIYSALMSTFYWEYGIEAFAEVPSIQDLVITPVLGWAYGEWAFTTEMSIRANNDEVWGSSILGSTALVMLDPVDSLSVGINNLFGKEIIKAGSGYVQVKDVVIGVNGRTESQIQLNISLQLGDGRHYHSSKSHTITNTNDPIDTSIIGVSYGVGYTATDDYWQVKNGQTEEYSLGLYFTRSFSAKVSYSKANLTNMALANNKLPYENYSLDGQYYFNPQSDLRPYITAGFGEMMWQKDNDLKTFQMNLGAGVHYKLTKNVALQGDWRHYYSTHTDTAENAITARVVYLLGKGER
ncbi:MAG: DUF3943 domain-containing protein [Colwellia sp.]